MALKFKIAKRKLNLGKRKGKTVYFAIQDEHPRTTWPQVERRIIQSTGISRADLRAAVIALHDIVEDELQAGRAADLADLGSIKALAQGKMMDKFDEVNATTIRPAHVRFYPKMSLRTVTKEVSYEVVKEAYQPHPKKSPKGGKSKDGSGTPVPPGGGTEGGGHVGA